MTSPGANDVLRRFNRDTAWFVVWLLGGLIFSALAFGVLIPEPHPAMAGLQRRVSQAGSAPSVTADAAELVKIVDSTANKSASQLPLGTLTHVDQRSTESSIKESHAQTEATAGSTPEPILVLSDPTPSIAAANASNWPPAQRKVSAQAIRGKAPYRKGKSSGVLRDVDVKKRLIELWHQSLARTEKEKARSWAIFSQLERRKKAAFIAPKAAYQAAKGAPRKLLKGSGAGEVSTTR